MAKKRFSFDDTIEYDKEELTPNNDLHATQFKNEMKDNKFVFNDEEKKESSDNGDKEVKKTVKKKKKINNFKGERKNIEKLWLLNKSVIMKKMAVFLFFARK